MLIPLEEVLALPALAGADPVVLHGSPDRCLIRWVHSSEIFEMGPLLQGGELLLTTGLGLIGTSDRELGRYVETLADAGLSALAIELGRTFSDLPDSLVDAARRCDLALIALRTVVPFEMIVEAFHTLLLDHEMHTLRIADQIWRDLLARVLTGDGLQSLIHTASSLAGTDAHLLALDGRTVVSTKPGAIPRPSRSNSRPVEVAGAGWGTLILSGQPGPTRTAVLDRAAVALGLELLRTGSTYDGTAAVNALLRDIAENRMSSGEELESRLELAGLPMLAGRVPFAIAVAADRRVGQEQLRQIAQRFCRESFGVSVAGQLDDDVVLVAHAPRGPELKVRAPLETMTSGICASVEQATGLHVVAVAAGPAATPAVRLTQSIGQALEVTAIARRLGARHQALLSRDVGIYRLLSRMSNEPELHEFVREQIGALLDQDASTSSELVQTLDAYLRYGLAKTETAHALGIRRQTLYNRLDRINRLLGPVLEHHESRTALALALHAWRLRTGASPRER